MRIVTYMSIALNVFYKNMSFIAFQSIMFRKCLKRGGEISIEVRNFPLLFINNETTAKNVLLSPIFIINMSR